MSFFRADEPASSFSLPSAVDSFDAYVSAKQVISQSEVLLYRNRNVSRYDLYCLTIDELHCLFSAESPKGVNDLI